MTGRQDSPIVSHYGVDPSRFFDGASSTRGFTAPHQLQGALVEDQDHRTTVVVLFSPVAEQTVKNVSADAALPKPDSGMRRQGVAWKTEMGNGCEALAHLTAL